MNCSRTYDSISGSTGSKVFEEHKLEIIDRIIIEKNITKYSDIYKLTNKSNKYNLVVDEIVEYLLITTDGDYEIYKENSRIKNIMKFIAKDIFKNRYENIPDNLKGLFKNILIYDKLLKPMRSYSNLEFVNLINYYPVTINDIQYLIDNNYLIIGDFFIKKICAKIKDENIFKILMENLNDTSSNFLYYLLSNENITIGMIDILFNYKFKIDYLIFECLFPGEIFESKILMYVIDKLFENYNKEIKDILQRYSNIGFIQLFGNINLFNREHQVTAKYLIDKLNNICDNSD